MLNTDRLIVETTHPKTGASIMNTLAPTTQMTRGIAKCVTIGSVCKAAAAVAVGGMISVVLIAELSRAHFAPTIATDSTKQPELRSLLCRIDRRCPAMDLAHQSPPRGETGDQTGSLIGRAEKMIE
jgi:hypothetical protein